MAGKAVTTYGANAALTGLCQHKLSGQWDQLPTHVQGLLNFASSSLVHAAIKHDKTDLLKKVVQVYLTYALMEPHDDEHEPILPRDALKRVADTFFFGVPFYKSFDQVWRGLDSKMKKVVFGNIPQFFDEATQTYQEYPYTYKQWDSKRVMSAAIRKISYLNEPLVEDPDISLNSAEDYAAHSTLVKVASGEGYTRAVKFKLRPNGEELVLYAKGDGTQPSAPVAKDHTLSLQDVQQLMLRLHAGQ